MEFKVFDSINRPTKSEKNEIANFLFRHLEQYGDPLQDIHKAMDYALKEFGAFGGLVSVLKEGEEILAAVVVNKTGMSGYIPENILVYIATHNAHRGKGLGKSIMTKVIEECTGDIALHVEADNPAKKLYEKLGFTNPYLEMRLKK